MSGSEKQRRLFSKILQYRNWLAKLTENENIITIELAAFQNT